MPAACASRAERKWVSVPSSMNRPENSGCTPAMIFISVLLPAPFSPTRPWISPALRAKSTSFRACTPPNVLEIPDISSSGTPPASTSIASLRRAARDQTRSDQEVIFHPLHARRVRLGYHRSIGDDMLGDAGVRLLARQHGGDAGHDGAAMNPA